MGENNRLCENIINIMFGSTENISVSSVGRAIVLLTIGRGFKSLTENNLVSFYRPEAASPTWWKQRSEFDPHTRYGEHGNQSKEQNITGIEFSLYIYKYI